MVAENLVLWNPGFNLKRGGDKGREAKRKQQGGTGSWRLEFRDEV